MTDSVTISLLPVTLSLVHLPRSRLDSLAPHVLRQILLPSPTFLNLTCNQIELSLFAERHALHDFQRIARKDARKHKTRRKDRSPLELDSTRRSTHPSQDWEPVEVSSDTWSVLQIDSHSDQLDNSGARVHELSAPLAAAGIPILYQSSYMSDFIFVKSFRLMEVMSLLASAGFDLYSSDPQNLTAQLSTFASPLLAPTADDNSSVRLLDLPSLQLSGHGVGPVGSGLDREGGAVFTRSRSNTDTTSGSSGSRSAHSRLQMSNPHDFDPDGLSDDDVATPAPLARPTMSRSQSHSPSGCEVRLLPPDLTYVGLADDSAEMWTLKIVKLVAFPDTIAGIRHSSIDRSRAVSRRRRSSSPAHVEPAGLIVDPLLHSCTATLTVDDSGSIRIVPASDGDTGSGSDTTTRVGPDSPKEDPDVMPAIHDIVNEEEEDADDDSSDGNYSASPKDSSVHLSEQDGDSEISDVSETCADSEASPDRPSAPNLDRTKHKDRDARRHSHSSSVSSASSCEAEPSPLVPFFSFTRSSEGSSLTAPVTLLAALFPQSERHMVICSDELDVCDSRAASPVHGDDTDAEDQDQDAEREAQGPLKCLQIDLRKFGLDKHGLVNRFSRTLEENGINHMYSSTYKTANLLVDKAHASRAQALLRSC